MHSPAEEDFRRALFINGVHPSCTILTPSNSRSFFRPPRHAGLWCLWKRGVLKGLSSEFLSTWAPNVFYIPFNTKHTQSGLMDLIPFLVHQSDILEGKGIFFSAMQAFSPLEMIASLVQPILCLHNEIMFRYKDGDRQSGRWMHFLITKSRQLGYFSRPTSKNLCLV